MTKVKYMNTVSDTFLYLITHIFYFFYMRMYQER